MRDPRLTSLAEVLVHYSVGVKKGQLCRIHGNAVSMPLINELYRQVVIAGANPVVRVAPDEAPEIFFRHASDEQLTFADPIGKYEIEKLDCSIGIFGESNKRALSQVDTGRLAKSKAARKEVFEILFRRSAEGSLKW